MEMDKLVTARVRDRAIEKSTSGITIADARLPDLPLIYINPAFEQMTGYTVAEAAGRNCRFLQGGDKDQPEIEILRAAIREGKACTVTLRNYRKDGTLFWNELNLSPIYDEQGELTHFLGIQTDVTARKLAEEKVKLYVDIFQNVQTGLVVFQLEDLHDDRTLRMIASNPAATTFTNAERGSMLGKTIDECFPGLRAQNIPQIYADVVRTRIPTTIEELSYGVSRVFSDTFYVKAFPLPNDCVGVSIEDITERKRIQQHIKEQNEALIVSNEELGKARKEAEESARLKSEFLATMSHELRTPLNAVIGYTEIQLAGMTGELNEEQRDYQERVLRNAENLLQLINEVLDLSKIEAGRIEMVKKPFVIHDWLNELITQMNGLAAEKNLTLEMSMDTRMPEIIIGDAARIKQIAINLLSNAIKFTEVGSVRVDVQKRAGGTWALIVSDTGIGIPSHALEYIFDEFRQVDGTSQRKHGGTGLGLSIVRKLALLMGGGVRVKSRVGEGTIFTVLLPLNTPREADKF